LLASSDTTGSRSPRSLSPRPVPKIGARASSWLEQADRTPSSTSVFERGSAAVGGANARPRGYAHRSRSIRSGVTSGSRSPARAWTHALAVAAISQLVDVRSVPRNECIPQLARSGVSFEGVLRRRTRRSCGLASKQSPRCVMPDSPF
jgi:hypothetical protein